MRHMEEMKIAGLAMALCIVMLGIYIIVPKDGTTSHLTAIPDNNAAQPVTDSTSQESADSGNDEYFPIYTEDSYNSETEPDYSYDSTDNTDNSSDYTPDNTGNDSYNNDNSYVSDNTGDTGSDEIPADNTDNSYTGSDEVIDDNTDTGDTSDSDLGDDTGDTGSDDTVEVY